MIFDENGKPITEAPSEELNGFDVSEVGLKLCPSCGLFFVVPADVVATKTKQRVCPRCQTIVGEW